MRVAAPVDMIPRLASHLARCVRGALRPATMLIAVAMMSGCSTNLGGGADVTTALTPPKSDTGTGKPQKPVRIAMLLPLSGFGPTAQTAKGMKQAGEMALFELDNPLVQLIVKDDKGTPIGAAAAAGEAIGEGAEIIVGPLTANATSTVGPIAKAAHVPVLSFSNDRRVAGDGIYLMSFLPEQEVDRVVAYAAGKGKRRFAGLVPDDGYGTVVEAAFHQAVERAGGTVGAVEKYPADANAMLSPVKRIVDEIKQSEDSGSPVDTLLLAGGAETLPQMGPIIAYAGLSNTQVKVIGTGGWDYPNSGRNPALANGWYPAPDPHGWQDFAQRFSRSFGAAPPRLASLSYDAVSLAITLSAFEPGQRFTAQNLTRPSGFTGVDGMMRFTADGLPVRSLAVLEVQAFGANVIDPSPGGNGAEKAETTATIGKAN